MHAQIILVATTLIVPSLAYLGVIASPSTSRANSAANATEKIPIREFETASATINEPLGIVLVVQHLPGGRLLVNDPSNHRLIVFDSM